MSVRHLLPDFTRNHSSFPHQGLEPDEVDQTDHFENGYKAGWDDAIARQASEGETFNTAIARNLQDLSFTYVEAHSGMVKSLRPLLEQLVQTVLPDMAKASLVPIIVEQLLLIGKEAGQSEVLLLVHPSNEAAISGAIDRDFGFPLRLVSEESVSESQIILRFSGREKEIDMTSALTQITNSVSAFFENDRKVNSYE